MSSLLPFYIVAVIVALACAIPLGIALLVVVGRLARDEGRFHERRGEWPR